MTKDPQVKREEGHGVFLIVLGLIAIGFAVKWLPHWSQLAPQLKFHLIVFLAAGIPIVLSGVAYLADRLVGLAGWVGGVAAAACGANLISGIVLGSIPCAGPT